MNRIFYILLIISLFISNQVNGNSLLEEISNCENDSIPPTLEVIIGTAYTIFPPQYAIILPKDLITKVSDNCVDSSNLQYKLWFNYASSFPIFNDIEELAALPDSLIFTENNLDTSQVYVVVYDKQGNYAYQPTYIITQCLTCGEPFPYNNISGQVITTKGEPIDSVKIGVSELPDHEIYTEQDGLFGLSKEMGKSHEINPQKIDNPTNGVTSFDLLLIQKHILGIETFYSPYMFLAADVDFSGTVTTFDLLTIKKVLLGKTDNFPLGDSWIFVLEDYQFTTLNPAAEDYPNNWKTPDLNSNYHRIDFIGVKLGDVNVSAKLSNENN